jgi:hypothetical protein
MVTTLSQLVDMTQGSAIPAWLRNQIVEKKHEIAAALKDHGEYTFQGPNGERVTVQADVKAASAA